MIVRGTKQDIKAIDTTEKLRKDFASLYKDLKFNEKKHKYTVDKKTLISVTTYISRFHDEFQSFHMSKAMEKKYSSKDSQISKPKNNSYFLRRWKYQSVGASTSGTRVHEYIEHNAPEFHEGPCCKQEMGAREFFYNLPDNYKLVALEKRIYSLWAGLAGTIDCILYNTLTGKYVIVDWKTNAKNPLQNYAGHKLSEPFQDLYATALNEYSLQLSLYKIILEENQGIEIEECWIIHLSDGDWTALDFSKADKTDKYFIVLANPAHVGDNYRRYVLTDYSIALKNHITYERDDRIRN